MQESDSGTWRSAVMGKATEILNPGINLVERTGHMQSLSYNENLTGNAETTVAKVACGIICEH